MERDIIFLHHDGNEQCPPVETNVLPWNSESAEQIQPNRRLEMNQVNIKILRKYKMDIV